MAEKSRCLNSAGQPCNWLERLTWRDPAYLQSAQRQKLVRRLGLSDRNALAVASDADAYTAVWFGVGVIAGSLFTALGCALLSREKPKEG